MIDPEQLQPILDRVLIRELPLPGKLIVIREDENSIDGRADGPGDYRRRPRKGIVIKAGPGKWIHPPKHSSFFRPTTIRPGQIVTFSSWQDWEDAPAGYFMVLEGDVWFVHRSYTMIDRDLVDRLKENLVFTQKKTRRAR